MRNVLQFIDTNLYNNGHDAIPEIQALRNVVENNPWHKDQSVFVHTKNVVEALQKYTKNELLLLAALFHDIAKPKTFTRDRKTKMTLCVDHEKKSAEMMAEIGPKIGITGKDLKYVTTVIQSHCLPALLLNELLLGKSREKHSKEYFLKTGVFARDLLLHLLADMEGGDLATLDPELFRKQKEIIQNLLK